MTVDVAACLKWVDLRPHLDPLSGECAPDPRGHGFSLADQAALELALQGRDRGLVGKVTALCAGPAWVEPALRGVAALGVDRLVRVDMAPGAPSVVAAAGLAAALTTETLVLCGDVSADRGTGVVPPTIAHLTDSAQACGVLEVEWTEEGVRVLRRLDGGRRERLFVRPPAVVSVEGAAATLRRAGLGGVLSAPTVTIDVLPGGGPVAPGASGWPEIPRPLRPPARHLRPPAGGDARERMVSITGALSTRTPPRVVTAEPEEAASVILDQLRSWGELE